LTRPRAKDAFPPLNIHAEMSSPVKKKRALDPNKRADSQSCSKPCVHDGMLYTIHKMLSNGWHSFKCSCFRAFFCRSMQCIPQVLPKDDEDQTMQGGNRAPAYLKHNSHKVLINAEVVNKAQAVQDVCTNLLKSNAPA
jgi:hypothetical protein